MRREGVVRPGQSDALPQASEDGACLYEDFSVVRHVFTTMPAAVGITPVIAPSLRSLTEKVTDHIASEVPVALVFNGISHAVMMATPLHLEDFAIGFSLAEHIITHPDELYDIDCIPYPDLDGIELNITIAAACFDRLKQRRRHLTGKTGCGLCGIDSLKALSVPLPVVNALTASGLPHHIRTAALQHAFATLPHWQTGNALTGALHAAAWADQQGNIQLVREDVGRHNALDKLIGALSADASPRSPGFVFMSSRASYEIVQKAAHANIAILAVISAPTTLAIRMAERAGICLIGFLRQQACVVYSHPERLSAE
jgi:FdhD protein